MARTDRARALSGELLDHGLPLQRARTLQKGYQPHLGSLASLGAVCQWAAHRPGGQ